MNIATELLGHIKARSLDSYYAIEESMIDGRALSKEDKVPLTPPPTHSPPHARRLKCSARLTTSASHPRAWPAQATLTQLLESSDKAAAEDRLRLLMLLQLHPEGHGASAEELAACEAALRDGGADLRPLTWLKGLQAMTQMQSQANLGQRAAAEAAGGGGLFSKAMKMADQVGVGSNARWVTSALAAGVKQLLPSRRETPLTRAVTSLMENKPGPEDDSYGYVDPKVSPTADGSGTARSRSPYGQAIVFVVGPGNYLEYLSLRQQLGQQPATGGGAKITYGCTEVLTPSQFLAACAECASA